MVDAVGIAVAAREAKVLGATKPRRVFALDWTYNHPSSGKKQHVVRVFQTNSAAKKAADSLNKYIEEDDASTTEIVEGVIDWTGYTEELEELIVLLAQGGEADVTKPQQRLINKLIKAHENEVAVA